MLVYDWMWRGHLTNQNLAWRGAQRCAEGCVEVHEGVCRGGVQRGVQRGEEGCMEVHRGCAEVCGVVRRGVYRLVHRGVQRVIRGGCP